MNSHDHVERVLKLATCMVQAGYGGAAAHMGLLCREFRADRTLWDALAQHKGPKGRTHLLHAALKCDAARVGFLIDRGSAVDWVSKKGLSAMSLACQGREARALPIVRQLVASKPEVARSIAGFSWACAKGHLDIVRYLLEKGADVNAAFSEGNTPLTMAAFHGHVEMVRFLMSCSGINMNATMRDGNTALMMTCERGSMAMVRHLAEAKGAAVGAARASDGKTALMLVIEKMPKTAGIYGIYTQGPETLETAAFLLRHGAAASVNAASPAGGSALSRACSAGNVALLHMLISHGATVDPPAPATPPLLLALDGGYEAVVSALLLYGANARAVDAAGRQALLVALHGGHGRAACALLESGADARASDGGGSALLLAVRTGCAEAVRALLRHGADAREVGAGDGSPLVVAARGGHVDAVRALQAGGADCAAVDAAGITALMEAARGGHCETAKLLLKHGANASAVDARGCSALLLSCVRGGWAPLTAILCASGADANAAATGTVADTCIIPGTTPLMAAAASKPCKIGSVEALLQHGAKPHAKDSAGREAVAYAKDKGAVLTLLNGLP